MINNIWFKIIAGKINKILEFYTIFARKMPDYITRQWDRGQAEAKTWGRGQSFETEAKILASRPIWPWGLNITASNQQKAHKVKRHANLAWNEVRTVSLQEQLLKRDVRDKIANCRRTIVALRHQWSDTDVRAGKLLKPGLAFTPVSGEAVAMDPVVTWQQLPAT